MLIAWGPLGIGLGRFPISKGEALPLSPAESEGELRGQNMTENLCPCGIINYLNAGETVRMTGFRGACAICGGDLNFDILYAIFLFTFNDGLIIRHRFLNFWRKSCPNCGDVPDSIDIYCGMGEALRASELEKFIGGKNK